MRSDLLAGQITAIFLALHSTVAKATIAPQLILLSDTTVYSVTNMSQKSVRILSLLWNIVFGTIQLSDGLIQTDTN